jgi:hypothetical protein
MLERCQGLFSSLEFKQLTATDIEEINELTDIDPWNISKSVTLEKIQDGWLCYVVKYRGQIVANGWTKAGPEIYEPHLRRSFTLADNEAYDWRGFCVPAFRGKFVLPWLNNRVVNHLALTAGVIRHVGFVRINNPAMWRTFVAMGWSVVGRVGFIEIFGVRLHYILGRRALSKTKKRFFIQVQKK